MMITELKKIIFWRGRNEAEPIELSKTAAPDEWLPTSTEDGELMVDIIDAPDKLIVRSTIAGAEIGDIAVHVHNDLLTIRGQRKDNLPEDAVYLYRECYFGPFSRSIILPRAVKEDKIEATLKNGVLTIILPKKEVEANIKIKQEK